LILFYGNYKNNIKLGRLVQNLPFLCYNFNDFIKGVDPNE